MKPDVAAVVVLHNSAATLRACLDALLVQPRLAEVALVDNASSDGWRAVLPQDARLHILEAGQNLGFAAGCDAGVAATTAPWLLFLNPDCLLEADSLARLIEAAAALPAPGAVGADLVHADGRPQRAARRETPTPRRVLRGLGLSINVAPPVRDDGAKVDVVDAISGALMLMPREVYRSVGGMDAGYRLHCEDLDLCRRLRQHGHPVGVARGLRVVHIQGTSSRRRPIWVEWQKHRGMWRYFSKFDRASTPWWLTALLATGLLLRFPWAAARAWLRARVG